MTVVYNDKFSVSQAVTADGVILFKRPDGVLSTGTIAVANWVQLAGDALDGYLAIASTTGKTTPLPSVTTATTGVL